MLFNSFQFIFLFLPITLIVYFMLNNFKQEKLSKIWLVGMSLYFYAYFNVSYLYLIILSICINYYIGNKLSKKDSVLKLSDKNNFLVGILFNVGMLFYFKYYDFFIKNMNTVFNTDLSLLKLMLPLGISFFTFQQLSYLVDSYKGNSKNYDFLSYCLFVTFFPQLIAGPIVLPQEMLPQFENSDNKRINYENMNKGLYLFSIGLAKKVLIADSIASFADAGFDKMLDLTFIEAWLTSISYTMQLYFDFSGYCDMAMGVALMFNIVLPLNFNSPYKATNIQEFWKRWHMTLGRFLTNYLYIPLGGNRNGERKTLRNLLIVFLASGVWHGAGWNFIIWGGLHGLSILIHRVWKSKGLMMPKIIGWGITLFSVNIFWIFFRATSIESAMKVIKGMFTINNNSFLISVGYKNALNNSMGNKLILLLLVIAILISIFSINSSQKKDIFKTTKFRFLECLLFLFSSIMLVNRLASFLYFNF